MLNPRQTCFRQSERAITSMTFNDNQTPIKDLIIHKPLSRQRILSSPLILPVASLVFSTCLSVGLIYSGLIPDYVLDRAVVKGEQGVVGIQGESGLNGKIGLQGEEGIAGLDGEQGEPGATGLNGIQGEVGAIGLTGAAGLNGAKGEAGVAGLNGVNGSPGSNGSTGATGNNGTNGSNGADGATSLFLKTKVVDTNLIVDGSEVIQLSLPAGSYLLVWTGGVSATTGIADYVNCGIEDRVTGTARAVMVDIAVLDGRAYMALQKSITLAAAGNVSVYCNTARRNGSALIGQQTFSAQKVSTVTIQP